MNGRCVKTVTTMNAGRLNGTIHDGLPAFLIFKKT